MTPYKDKKQYKEWFKRWSDENRDRLRQKWRNAYWRKREKISQRRKERFSRLKEKCREELKRIFGTRCIICGGIDKRSKIGVSFHNIKNEKHPYNQVHRKYQYIIAHKEDFIPVCISCHNGIHWLQGKVGLTWEQIKQIIPALRNSETQRP